MTDARDDFAELPVDSDSGADAGNRTRQSRIRYAGDLGLVFAGGTVGTALRALVGTVLPGVSGLPVGTLVVNLTGAFALGVLLESLAMRGADSGGRRRLRLLCGTGLLGGYTTYSALALETSWGAASVLTGAVYGLGSVVLGAALALAGIATARAFRPRRPS